MVAPGALPPGITPAPTLAMTARGLMPRATTYGCLNVNSLNCDNGIGGCLQSAGFQNNTTRAAPSCYCSYGIGYLQCFSSALAAKCSGFGSDDFAYYQVSWFSSMCGTVPATAMAEIKPPSTVALSLAPVESTRLSSRSTPPPRTSTPAYTGIGRLLGGGCDSISYTLVDAGSSVYWAGYVGCINDRPECCPWPVANTVATDGPPTITTDGGGGGIKLETGGIGAAYPSPRNSAQLVLSSCADDYYSISGSCCPNGFFPFTRPVGGQTPCWSSANRVTTAPTLTANVVGQPIETEKPTSAVVNIVWAVQYPVAPSQAGSGTTLPAGAIAGISVGGAAVVFGLALAVLFLWRRRKAAATPASGNNGHEHGSGSAAAAATGDPYGAANAADVMPKVPFQVGVAPPQSHAGGAWAAGPMMQQKPNPVHNSTSPPPNPPYYASPEKSDWVAHHQGYYQPSTSQTSSPPPPPQGWTPSMQQQQYQRHSRHPSSVDSGPPAGGGRPTSEISSISGGAGSPGPSVVYMPSRYYYGDAGR